MQAASGATSRYNNGGQVIRISLLWPCWCLCPDALCSCSKLPGCASCDWCLVPPPPPPRPCWQSLWLVWASAARSSACWRTVWPIRSECTDCWNWELRSSTAATPWLVKLASSIYYQLGGQESLGITAATAVRLCIDRGDHGSADHSNGRHATCGSAGSNVEH